MSLNIPTTICFQFSTLNVYRHYGCHLKGRADLVCTCLRISPFVSGKSLSCLFLYMPVNSPFVTRRSSSVIKRQEEARDCGRRISLCILLLCAESGISSSSSKHCNQRGSGYWLGDEYENWRCVQVGSTVAENEETEENAEHRRLGLLALDQSVQLRIRRQYFRSEFSRTGASEERVEIRFEMLLSFLEFWFREG